MTNCTRAAYNTSPASVSVRPEKLASIQTNAGSIETKQE